MNPCPRRRRGLVSAVVAICLLGASLSLGGVLGAAPAAAAVDPFYDLLYQDGLRAAGRGDAAGAAKMLRLACFGMLQDPPVLASCLTHLALAQAELDDREAFLETADRLLQAERLHGAWGKATLSDADRRRLEERLASWLPVGELEGAAAFSRADALQRAETVRALPPEERRRLLDRQLALAPENTVWRLLWAELELESGRPKAALREAENVLRRAPGQREARCIRGRAQVSLEVCSMDVADDLGVCPLAAVDAVTERLRCMVELAEWSRASELLESLPETARETAAVRELEKTIRRGRRGESSESSSS